MHSPSAMFLGLHDLQVIAGKVDNGMLIHIYFRYFMIILLNYDHDASQMYMEPHH